DRPAPGSASSNDPFPVTWENADSEGRLLHHRRTIVYNSCTTVHPRSCGMAPQPTPTRSTDWKEAGVAWGARAVDWACLFEHYARPANDVLLDRLVGGAGVSPLD